MKWKLAESEGMASVMTVINIINNFNSGTIPPYVHVAPTRSGQYQPQGAAQLFRKPRYCPQRASRYCWQVVQLCSLCIQQT